MISNNRAGVEITSSIIPWVFDETVIITLNDVNQESWRTNPECNSIPNLPHRRVSRRTYIPIPDATFTMEWFSVRKFNLFIDSLYQKFFFFIPCLIYSLQRASRDTQMYTFIIPPGPDTFSSFFFFHHITRHSLMG